MDNQFIEELKEDLPPPVVEDSHYSTLNDEQEYPEIVIELSGLPKQEHDSNVSTDDMIALDRIVDQIGIGWHHYLMFTLLTIFGVTEGAQITIFTLTIPILQQEWGVSNDLTSMQASCVFVGFLFGALAAGQFIDRYGRRLPFIISAFFTILACVGSALCENIYELLMMRFLLGIIVGFFAPCSVTILQEITPKHLRGRFMSIVTISVALGQLYALWVASLIMSGIDEGPWRELTFWCTLPAAVAWFLALLIVEESPRFLLLQGQSSEAFRIIDKIIERNRSDMVISYDTQIKLQNWAEHINSKTASIKNAQISALFNPENRKITIILWMTWFALCFTYYGNILIMPYLIDHVSAKNQMLASDPITQLVISCASDVMGGLIGSMLIEVKGFGRKNSLIIFMACAAISATLVYFISQEYLIYSTIEKFFLSMSFLFLYQVTSEVYPTKLRATGLGTAIAVGRLGGIILPWVVMPIINSVSIFAPFILFALVAILASVSDIFLYETMGKELLG